MAGRGGGLQILNRVPCELPAETPLCCPSLLTHWLDSPWSKLWWFFRGLPLWLPKDGISRFPQQARQLLESWCWEPRAIGSLGTYGWMPRYSPPSCISSGGSPHPVLPHSGCPGPCIQPGDFTLFPGSIPLVFRPISGPMSFQAPFPDTCPTLKLCLIFQTFSKSGLTLHPPQTPVWTVSEIFPLYLVTLCSHGARVSRSS